MANDRDDTKTPGSITEAADSQDRISEISNVNRTIAEMQRKTQQQINETKMDTGELDKVQEVEGNEALATKRWKGLIDGALKKESS